MHLCRLCGEHKSPLDLNFELSDNTGLQWSYRELIEHHTRVALKTNKLLPQSICEECRLEIERFADFSSRVQNVQDTLVSVVDDAEEVKNVITHLTEISFQSDENCAKISKDAGDGKSELEELTREQLRSDQRAKRKRVNSESLDSRRIKAEEQSVVENSSDDSNYEEDSDSEEYGRLKSKRLRKDRKRSFPSKRSNNARKTQETLFGAEYDSFEKLYADELAGTSKLTTKLHLNVSESYRSPNGEIPEEHVEKIAELRWKDVLSCGVCKIPFDNINDLLDHADVNHNTRAKVFHCLDCDGEFTALNESILVNHLVERHFYEHLKFCCMVCSEMFFDLPSLVNHSKLHEGKFKLLVCLICGWYAKNLDDLREHKACHVTADKSENQLLCERVFDKFNSGTELSIRNHFIAEFERKPDGTVNDECQSKFLIDWSFGSYECPTCVVSFSKPFDLFVHQRLKHSKEVDKKIFSCSLCIEKKEYSNLFTFVNHATAKHFEHAKFTCVVCAKVFWNYLALANHYKNVHPSFPCIFCCHCGKIFMNVTIAASHFKSLNLMRTPEERQLLKEGKLQEDTNHVCCVCARNFKNRGTLLNHEKTHETLEPSELLQCHLCSKFYKNKYKLAQHMVCHEDLRSWKCKACGQAFNYKKLLQRHVQAVHQNDRPFGCSYCEKRFNSKYDLTVHVRLHTGDFPYDCPVIECDAKYPAWSNLFKHCQSRHKLDIRSEGYKKLKATQKSQKSVDEEQAE